jgi:hypothetical protein
MKPESLLEGPSVNFILVPSKTARAKINQKTNATRVGIANTVVYLLKR